MALKVSFDNFDGGGAGVPLEVLGKQFRGGSKECIKHT